MKIRLIVLLAFLFAGCQAMQARVKPALETEGEIIVYLEPLSQGTDRLTFEIEGISAIRESGEAIPLSLAFRQINGRNANRQRLLAHGSLPPGRYGGLSMKIGKATLLGEDGETSLLVPDNAVFLSFPFPVDRKKSRGVSLSLNYAASLQGGFLFRPVFVFSTPSRPLAGLAGYVTNTASNNITVFDKKRAKVSGMIATGTKPAGMAFDRRRGRLFAAVTADDAIDVIDIATEEVLTRIRLNFGDAPWELVLTSDGKALVVTNSRSNTVSIIDTASFIELRRIPVGSNPEAILMDRAGRRAYIFNRFSTFISVIDVPMRTLVASVPTEPGPFRGQFNQKGDRLYVIHDFSPYLEVIDILSASVVRKVFVGAGVGAIKVDSVTDYLYVGNGTRGGIDIYDPISFVPIDQIPVQGAAGYLAIDDEENNLLVILPESQTLLMVNLFSKERLAEMDVGEDPYAVVLAGERP